jgi:hypothetical protein
MTSVTNGISRGRQALRRDVNQRISAGSDAEVVEVFCECGHIRCANRIRIATHDYEQVRASAACFVVSAGHEETGADELVGRHNGYVVVERKPRR